MKYDRGTNDNIQNTTEKKLRIEQLEPTKNQW